MTEAEWLVSDNPRAMVYYLAGGSQGLEGHNDSWHVSARKLRLFSCAVARSRWHLLGLVAQGCVEVAECRADGLASSKDRGEAFNRADLLRDFEGTLARACLRANAASGAYDLTSAMTDSTGKIHRLWCDILRDIVGNPFRPVTWAPPPPLSGIGLEIRRIAQAAYDERLPNGTLDPARLAVLSDALEEAGCVGEQCPECGGIGRFGQDHPFGDTWATEWLSCHSCEAQGRLPHPLIAHLRSPGPHVRGCWALDLILGKE